MISRRTASAGGVWFLALGAILLIGPFTPSQAQELFSDASDVTFRDVDRMYVRGLSFLATAQRENGTWDDSRYGKEPGVIGLATVSFLAHGDDPNTGPYSQPIQRALTYILENQNSKTGYIGSTMYNHGFATLALAESYGAVDNARLGPALEKAVGLILESQKQNPVGAWRYSPESKDADTTVSGAQMVALFAARNAGLAVPESAIQQGLKFMLSCQTPEGGFGYTTASSPNTARTAIGCLTLALAKEKHAPQFQSSVEFLKNAQPQGNYYHYYLYYASQAFFHASPEAWRGWNVPNIATLKAAQEPDGSWDGQFGKPFTTAASLLSLALNYRFLPIYER